MRAKSFFEVPEKNSSYFWWIKKARKWEGKN